MFIFKITRETVCLLSNRKSKPDSYVKVPLDMEDYYRIKDGKEPKSKEE